MSGCLLDIKMTENLVCVVSHNIRGWNVGEFCGQCFRFFILSLFASLLLSVT